MSETSICNNCNKEVNRNYMIKMELGCWVKTEEEPGIEIEGVSGRQYFDICWPNMVITELEICENCAKSVDIIKLIQEKERDKS